jgi:tyrosyl-tRNA synthetase
MDTKSRYDLIMKKPTEEIITDADLKGILETSTKIKHYMGFEISGFIHLGVGLVTGLKIAQMQKAGVDCSIFLADWHAWINNKLGGDLKTITKVAGGFFKEGMYASIKAMGGNPDKVRFVLGSDLYHHNDEYWKLVIDVAKKMTLKRALRSITIMGRNEGDDVEFGQLIYPAMQVADIFIQDVKLAHAGTDQRKAHVIAREVGAKLKTVKPYKPIAIHQHLILGLNKPTQWPIPPGINRQELLTSMKMSKSIASSSVFIHEPAEVVEKKIMSGFCPAKDTSFNPVLDWCEYLIFPSKGELSIKRPEKYGGNVVYDNYSKLEKDFASGKLHPSDLKKGTADSINSILEPVRKHFSKKQELIKEMEKIKITR